MTISPNGSPSVSIDAPVGSISINFGQVVNLMGTATDSEDGDLSAVMSWSSSLDGDLGSGDNMSIDTLSVGLHGVTAQVTDSHGAVGSAQTVVSVPEPAMIHSLIAGVILLLGARRRSQSSIR